MIGARTSIYAGTTKSPRIIREFLIESALNVGILLFELTEDNEVRELDLPMSDWTAITKAGRTGGLDSDEPIV